MRRLITVVLLASCAAWAQDKPANLQPLPAIPPPPPDITSWDAALEPQVTIKRTEKEVREEFRVNGRLYMIKVTPVGAPSYYLVDQNGAGNFAKTDVGGPTTRPPMWILKEF